MAWFDPYYGFLLFTVVIRYRILLWNAHRWATFASELDNYAAWKCMCGLTENQSCLVGWYPNLFTSIWSWNNHKSRPTSCGHLNVCTPCKIITAPNLWKKWLLYVRYRTEYSRKTGDEENIARDRHVNGRFQTCTFLCLMTSTMHRDNDDDNGFRLSNLIDLVFPRWKDVAIIQPHDYSMGKAMRYYRVWIYVSCAVTVIPGKNSEAPLLVHPRGSNNRHRTRWTLQWLVLRKTLIPHNATIQDRSFAALL